MFTPIEAGSYKVTYTATDMAGNVNVYEYELLIIEDYTSGLANFFNKFGFILAIIAVAAAGVLVYMFLKQNAAKKSEIKDFDFDFDEEVSTEDTEK